MENIETKKQKCSSTQKGRIVVHKGEFEKRIYLEQLEEHLAKGWEKGASEKHKRAQTEKHLGKKPWNKGTKGVMKKNSGTWEKDHEPWNKDKKIIDSLSQKFKEEIVDHYLYKCNSIEECAKKFNVKKYIVYEVLKAFNVVRTNIEASKNRTEETIKIKVSKDYITKKINNSFNTSNPEEVLYKQLLEDNKNKTIYRQYKDSRYPFYCDFYIKEDDLFIELNNHWTHGGHPFDPNNKEDLEKLALWEEKAKKSKFYKNAIIVWTIRDVEKQKCAKENNLNYITIY